MSDDDFKLVDWVHFERSRAELGAGFIRILSYFREDGAKSVAQIEEAMHDQNTAALVIPAHTIKGEARQFGAEPLAQVAELIESTARLCVESRRSSAGPLTCSTGRPTRYSRVVRRVSAARSATRTSGESRVPSPRPLVAHSSSAGL
jgi:HPt (histidine-containing phosphotransfer) domain-containing protein